MGLKKETFFNQRMDSYSDELNLLEKGMLLDILVKNGNCYTTDNTTNYQTFLGTISKENFSWIGNVEVTNGVMPLVVLECEEGKPIVFGKKQITSIHDLVVTPEDIEFLLEKIDNLNRTVDQLNYHYRNQ